jgi:eukaryotic-like serine/threonine-protein kinase
MDKQPPFTQLVGTMAGIYRLEQLVTQNMLGAAFIAHTDASNTLYRLRLLRLSSRLTPEARIVLLGHFQQQARELSELLSDQQKMPKHPHLLPLVDYGNVQNPPGFLYLVSPHTPMRSLTTLLSEKGALDVLTIGSYLDQVASALEYAHQHAVIHRDLTTDAVFIRNDGRLVIADLGVMRILTLSRPADQQILLYGHSPTSTPVPEQLLGQPVDTSTDVYALGAILYRLLCGHRVFSANNRDSIIQQHLHDPVPSLAQWRPITIGQRNATAELDHLITAAMAKDPAQRIRHPAELANRYHQIVAPNDLNRQPIATPGTGAPMLAAATSAPIAAAVLKSARTPPASAHRADSNTPRSGQINASRRRMLLLLGGGGAVVVVGAVALIVEQLLNNNAPPGSVTVTGSQPTRSPATGSSSTGHTVTAGHTVTPGHTGTVIARTADVPLDAAKTFPLPNGGANPGVLVHLQNGQFVAFDSTCTHDAHCPVAYDPQQKLLVCPCHGAEFDPANHASVVQGPAPTPLTPVQITVNADGTITVG